MSARRGERFGTKEDKAYLSGENAEEVFEHGGEPLILPNVNSTGGIRGLFEKMVAYLQDEFLQHYHKRSDVQSKFSAGERKLEDGLIAQEVRREAPEKKWRVAPRRTILEPKRMEQAMTNGSSRQVYGCLWSDDGEEETAFLQEQLITYIGNKRSLLGHLGNAIGKVKERLGKDRLKILDAFSGSGVVSRYCKAHAEYLAANDIEQYATIISRCYLRNRSEVDLNRLEAVACDLNGKVDGADFPPGFIEEMYSPTDEHNIKEGDRVFYTRQNARRLDNYRRLLGRVSADDRLMLLGPLLSKASVHANTSGVFKGFYKDRHSKIGKFGGSNGDALTRIKGEIRLAAPILSRFECSVQVFQEDANRLVHHLRGLDLAYFDPPYNQHPYGSNYFMLNLLVAYKRPTRISKVSGIPVDWTRSGYNVRSQSFARFAQLAQDVDAKFILVSFNDEGFIKPNRMYSLLEELGKVDAIELPYNTFRGSRNLRNRKIHVTEHLFLVERRGRPWPDQKTYENFAPAPLSTPPRRGRKQKLSPPSARLSNT